MPPYKQPCSDLIKLGADLKNLAENFDKHCEAQNGNLKGIWGKLDELNKSLTKRPSWAVSIIITALCSGAVGLLVAYLTLLSRR